MGPGSCVQHPQRTLFLLPAARGWGSLYQLAISCVPLGKSLSISGLCPVEAPRLGFKQG